MAGQHVTTDLAAMHKASAGVEDVRQQMVGEIKQLQSEAAQALASSWSGGAAGKFQGVAEQINTSAIKLHQILQSMGENINTNKTGYGSQDDTFSQTLSGAGGGNFAPGAGLA